MKDSDVGIRRPNADAYPGLGLIRIGAGEALTIGNAGTFVDLTFDNSAITLVDILSLSRASQHSHGRLDHLLPDKCDHEFRPARFDRLPEL